MQFIALSKTESSPILNWTWTMISLRLTTRFPYKNNIMRQIVCVNINKQHYRESECMNHESCKLIKSYWNMLRSWLVGRSQCWRQFVIVLKVSEMPDHRHNRDSHGEMSLSRWNALELSSSSSYLLCNSTEIEHIETSKEAEIGSRVIDWMIINLTQKQSQTGRFFFRIKYSTKRE